MKAQILMLAFLVFGFIGNSHAGREIGNGGGGVYCIYRPKLVTLDFFEANHFSVGPSSDILDVEEMKPSEITDHFLNRLRRFPNFFEEDILPAMQEIGSVDSWPIADYIAPISDHGMVYRLPKDCRYVQLAARIHGKVFLNGYWYFRSHRPSKAQMQILHFHEVVYEVAVKKGALNSASTRHLIARLLNIKSTDRDIANAIRHIGGDPFMGDQ